MYGNKSKGDWVVDRRSINRSVVVTLKNNHPVYTVICFLLKTQIHPVCIQKPNCLGLKVRRIVSGYDSYRISWFLSKVLCPLLKLFPYHISTFFELPVFVHSINPTNKVFCWKHWCWTLHMNTDNNAMGSSMMRTARSSSIILHGFHKNDIERLLNVCFKSSVFRFDSSVLQTVSWADYG